jgi:hypothetical protein
MMNEGVDNLVPPDADHFINTLKRYHAFYKTCDYRLLIVKENQRWLVLGGIIRLSSEDKNPSTRRPFLSLDNWYNSLVSSYRFHTKTSALYSRLDNRELSLVA